MQSTKPERRTAARYQPTDLDAVVLTGLPEEFREVKVRSISKTGIAIEVNIEAADPLDAPLGRKVTLSFMVPQVARIATVHAEVVRTYRQVSDGGFVHVSEQGEEHNELPHRGRDSRVYGLGLRFVDIKPEMARQLERYLWSALRSAGEENEDDQASPDDR